MFLIITLFLTTLSLEIVLQPPQYYHQSFIPGTQLEMSGNISKLCQINKGEIVYSLKKFLTFEKEILSFTKFQNQTLLFLLQDGQIVDIQLNNFVTIESFNSKNCKIVTNDLTISVFCFDSGLQYIIDDKSKYHFQVEQINYFSEADIKDVQVISDQYITLKKQKLYFNNVELIDSITVTVEGFRIINHTLIFISNRMITSEIYIYNYAHQAFEFNRRQQLKSKIENIKSVILSSNDIVYVSTDNYLFKYDESETKFQVQNIKNLYFIDEILVLLAVSEYGVFINEDMSVAIPELISLPIQTLEYHQSLMITRQTLYEIQFRKFDPEFFCFAQQQKNKGFYEGNLIINDKEVQEIKMSILNPIITTENQYWIWLSIILFCLGVILLIYCAYGQYSMYMIRYQQITKAKKGAYLKQL